jgi:cell division protein FtsB
MRLLTLVLAGLLLLVQAELWLGSGGVPHVVGLRSQLAEQQARNDAARERNARLAAEVQDLKAGLEMVEEKARGELGMLKPDEILVQVTTRR